MRFYTSDDVIEHINIFLRTFGIVGKPERKAENNKPNVFPYHWDESTMEDYFKNLLNSRESYHEFVDTYKWMIHDIEPIQKQVKQLRSTAIFRFDQELAQSDAALIGAALHRLYWLRTMARQWRRHTNEMKVAA